VGDPGGGIDDPGGGDTGDLGSFGNLATSTTTSSKTSVSFVSSSLTTGFSLLSLSDKSAVMVEFGKFGLEGFSRVKKSVNLA
jgi:hypothetical protein